MESYSPFFSNQIESQISDQNKLIEIDGTDSPLAIALQLGALRLRNSKPFVVVAEKEGTLDDFKNALDLFYPQIECISLLESDVSPYSGLYPRPRLVAERIAWCHRAQQNKGNEIFLATARGLAQITLPVEALFDNSFQFSVDEEFPENIAEFLQSLGYESSPSVEDLGSYAIRGGILDIYSPAHEWPIRIELFGEVIESMRFFDPVNQRSMEQIKSFTLIPAREIFFRNEEEQIRAAQNFKKSVEERNVPAEDANYFQSALARANYVSGMEFLVHSFYGVFTEPLEHFTDGFHLIEIDPVATTNSVDQLLGDLKAEREHSLQQPVCPDLSDVYRMKGLDQNEKVVSEIRFSKIKITDHIDIEDDKSLSYSTHSIQANLESDDRWLDWFNRFKLWKESLLRIFLFTTSDNLKKQIETSFEGSEFKLICIDDESEFDWTSYLQHQDEDKKVIHLLPHSLSESLRINDERIILLRDIELLGKQSRKKKYKDKGSLAKRASALDFADLKPGDNVVHGIHGVGVYEGLKTMPIGGIDAEFLEITYKDKDKLYLPIYRIGQIHKYSGGNTKVLDKLGGKQFEKTKGRVKKRLRELAAELITLYAKRKETTRPPLQTQKIEYQKFSDSFPFEETEDQNGAIDSLFDDFERDQPMDRLICGDVGFGKTEVAMRAAFIAAQNGFQVAMLAPTTILTFQHFESFQKRFKGFDLKIRSLNRFVPNKEVKKILEELKSGEVNIIIGTHRLLSKDVEFNNLGLLIVDEEQKFGVGHKERIRKLKVAVDTLAMSATPIPRTLNMSLTGIRDLSIINTAPIDRLPTRTFVTRFDRETIRKAVEAELSRGGQIFFLHNRVQTIYNKAAELREFLPKVKIGIGHGQMDEKELEKTMLAFHNKEIDILLSTTIIESGIDIPNANTMFIDDAQNFGLSQLYQLRGRVGRSKRRAYCYLLIPKNKVLDKEAQERLKVIQEHTALGSGIMIAQHDLELRGSGTLLGEEQSGHINAVGYEMFLELLEETIQEAKGEEVKEKIEPEINLRVPALIPSNYIPDIRVRLSFYKRLSDIDEPYEIDQIEDDLRDQFGKLPTEVVNLLGVMLIRHLCKTLGIKDLSAGAKTITLAFSENTPLDPATVIKLTAMENKKYSITPDNRFIIRMNQIEWPKVLDELNHLLRFVK